MKKGNYPAFPFSGFVGAPGIPAQPSNSGISLRDYIAVQAMKARIGGEYQDPESLSKFAYDVADEMLLEREAQ